jgi:hypothetical protein
MAPTGLPPVHELEHGEPPSLWDSTKLNTWLKEQSVLNLISLDVWEGLVSAAPSTCLCCYPCSSRVGSLAATGGWCLFLDKLQLDDSS